MATTKIWAIKDSLSRVLQYAANPDKTVLSDLKAVLHYAENSDKTANEEGQRNDLTSEQLAPKLSTELIAEQEGTSKDTVKRYIRLTKLIPDILKMVDEQRIAFSVGVELSYLTEYEQKDLFEAIELEDKTPSLSQAIQMKKLSQAGKLNSETISKIISEEKPNQREKISFQLDELSKYFPKKYTPQDIYNRLLKLAQDDYRRRQRNREER